MPSRQAILTKSHQSCVKRAQQPAHAHRDIQWESLLRRAQRAEERGDVRFLYRDYSTDRAVGGKDYYRQRTWRLGFLKDYFGVTVLLT